MSEQNEQLFAFMKKQISEKSTKKTAHPTNSTVSTAAKSADSTKNPTDENEMNEEEQLEEAKKLSKNKAAQRNNAELVKRMLVENLTKYALLISFLTVFAFAVIKAGPGIVTGKPDRKSTRLNSSH